MSKCDLCGDKSAILYSIENPEKPGKKKYHLCKSCLKTVHDAYVEIR